MIKCNAVTNAASLVGRWYAVGPRTRAFSPHDSAFAISTVVADSYPGLSNTVTIRDASGAEHPLHLRIAERITITESPNAFAAKHAGEPGAA